MRFRLTLSLLFITTVCFGQVEYGTIPSEVEKRHFMDTFLLSFSGRRVTNWRPVYDTTTFRLWPAEKVCDYLDVAECNFLIKQIACDQRRKWRRRDLKKAGLELRSNQKDIWHFSTPLFTLDRQHVIIGIGNHCGSLCGEGDIYIYRKQDDKWVLWKKVAHWVS